MEKEVKVVKVSEIEPKVSEEGHWKLVNLITKGREHSENASVHIAMLEAEFDDPEMLCEESDEILYQLEGDATITWKDEKVEFHPGMAIYIPKNTKWHYKCHNKNKHIVVWAPADEHYE